MMRYVLPLLVLLGAGAAFWSVLSPHELGLGAAVFPDEVTRGGEAVDRLFDEIAALMGFLLLLTAGLIAWVVVRGAGRRDGLGSERTGSAALEFIWTALPAVALALLLVRQLEVRKVLADAPSAEGLGAPFVVGVDAHQFEWRFRYPGRDGAVWTADDVVTVNELALPAGRPVELVMRSRDVIHSFFAPALRTKRDIVPGRDTRLAFVIDPEDLPLGFTSGQEAQLGLECAELCGWGHGAMVGRIRVLGADALTRWLTARSDERLATD
ncbi:MAG: cytochrome c oxidase subunit II transmembrane domain-containing protein [Planctomycetota bacterium]